MEWRDTGLIVFETPQTEPTEADAQQLVMPGVLSLPVYPGEFNRSYVSDHDELVIPSPDGNPANQRIIYVLSHTIEGRNRQTAIYEIIPGTGLLLAYGPPELHGDNRIPGNSVQPHIFPIEVQRPGQPPEYQPRVMAVIERPDKSAWTLRLLYPDPPIYWRRYLPG
jgi:hypothetical protein